MLSNATSTGWINQHQRKENEEKRNENQTDQRVRGRSGEGSALLYGGTGLRQEGRFHPGPISLADRGLARGGRRDGAAAGAEQQPHGQSVSGGDCSTGPTRGHLLHRRHQGRLRAGQGPRCRVYDASYRRARFDHCHAERHLRQPRSARPVGTLRRRQMRDREPYTPGPAGGAQVRKEGENWTLILVRELRHPPEKVWEALTDPAHLREWAPFEADGSLGTVGSKLNLATVGAPTPQVSETTVRRADAPKVLEYNWGAQSIIRWELEALGGGTHLTLWHNIDRPFISMGAAG